VVIVLAVAIPPKLKQLIGKSTPPRVVEIEKSQIRRFAAAVGEDSPVHFDEVVAKAAGYPSIVGTPTFAASLIQPDAFLDELGWDPGAVMHRSEEYEYYKPLCAGDVVTVTHNVADLYDKDSGQGSIIFLIVETRANDKRGKPVFKGRRTLVKLRS
jgi:acyl dehydratase